MFKSGISLSQIAPIPGQFKTEQLTCLQVVHVEKETHIETEMEAAQCGRHAMPCATLPGILLIFLLLGLRWQGEVQGSRLSSSS